MVLNKKIIKQAILFLIVGVITLLIDLSVTVILNKFLHFPPYLSSSIGFLSGFVFNFPMNRKKVFNHSVDDRFKLTVQIYLYIALCAFNLFVTSVASEVLVYIGLHIAIAKILITGTISVWNFLIFKFFVFSKKK